MKALKKKKKMYKNGGETDPPNGKKNKSKKAKVMGLPGQQVYTEGVPKRHQDFSDPSKHSEQYHHKGDIVAPAYNLHKETGVYRKGHGQVSRAVDPSKSPYIKNVVKGSKGALKKKYDEGGRLERQLKRKKRKLAKITPQEGSGPAKSAGTTQPLAGIMTFDMGDSGGCPPGQKRGLRGSCKKGNLRAEKSEPSKGLKREKTKANLAGKGLPQKRKKLTAEISDLEKRLRAMKKPGEFTNPRFL